MFAALERERLRYVSVDEPDLPGARSADRETTGAVAYVRFHGRNREAWWGAESRARRPPTAAPVRTWDRSSAALPTGPPRQGRSPPPRERPARRAPAATVPIPKTSCGSGSRRSVDDAEGQEDLRLLQQLPRGAGGDRAKLMRRLLEGEGDAVTAPRDGAESGRGAPSGRGSFEENRARAARPPAEWRGVRRGPSWLGRLTSRDRGFVDGPRRGAARHHEPSTSRGIPARPALYGDLAEPLPRAPGRCSRWRGSASTGPGRRPDAGGARGTVAGGPNSGGGGRSPPLPRLWRGPLEAEGGGFNFSPPRRSPRTSFGGSTASRHPALGAALTAGTYDGDTPATTRRKLRDEANLILSNPDMLHQGILPQPSALGALPRALRYVVVDEMHAYRGIFGSHVANVLRRLERLVAHYGGDPLRAVSRHDPQSRRAGEALIGRDGARRRRRRRAARPGTSRSGTRRSRTRRVERRSSNVEGCAVLAALMSAARGDRVHQVARRRRAGLSLRQPSGCDAAAGPAERIKPYRGGYLPEERRAIERRCSRASSRRDLHQRARAGHRRRRPRRRGDRSASRPRSRARGSRRAAPGAAGAVAGVVVAYNDTSTST